MPILLCKCGGLHNYCRAMGQQVGLSRQSLRLSLCTAFESLLLFSFALVSLHSGSFLVETFNLQGTGETHLPRSFGTDQAVYCEEASLLRLTNTRVEILRSPSSDGAAIRRSPFPRPLWLFLRVADSESCTHNTKASLHSQSYRVIVYGRCLPRCSMGSQLRE